MLLTAGNSSRGLSAKTFLFNCDSAKWVTDPAQPDLQTPRRRHSSVAVDSYAFVFAGFDKNDEPINSIERLALGEGQGNAKDRQWKPFTIMGLTMRVYPLMVALDNSAILVVGGHKRKEYFPDGVVFDAEKLSVINRVTIDQGFTSKGNQHCVT